VVRLFGGWRQCGVVPDCCRGLWCFRVAVIWFCCLLFIIVARFYYPIRIFLYIYTAAPLLISKEKTIYEGQSACLASSILGHVRFVRENKSFSSFKLYFCRQLKRFCLLFRKKNQTKWFAATSPDYTTEGKHESITTSLHGCVKQRKTFFFKGRGKPLW
jgi:hypothetical protein